jgi:integrase
LKSFFIEVSAKSPGKGTYRVRNTVNGKNQTISLGDTNTIDLSSARKRAKEIKALYALNKNPYLDVQKQKAIPTWSQHFADYITWVKPRKRTYKKDEDFYRLRCKAEFGEKRLDQITQKQIASFHSGLLDEGLSPASADRYLSHCKAVLSYAVRLGIIRDNVAKSVPLFNIDNQVENYLNREELGRLLNALRTDGNKVVSDIVLLILNSGARLLEAQMMKLESVNFEQRYWTVEASNSKSKRSRRIPCNDMTMEIIERNRSDNEYIFVNPRTGTAYNNIHKSWDRIRNSAQLPLFRLHDGRHQFAKMLVSDGGRSLIELQRILGHSSPIMTQRYAHLSNETLLEASNAASDAIQAAMDKASGDGQR